MKKSNNGITLVALVITIIILLILAGITISQLSGSGLFENAKLAKEKSDAAQEKEEGILDDYQNQIGEYIDGNREEQSVSYYEGQYCRIEKVGKLCILTTKYSEYSLNKTYSSFVLETVPEEYRPKNQVTTIGAGGDHYRYVDVRVTLNTNGEFVINTAATTYSVTPECQLMYTVK